MINQLSFFLYEFYNDISKIFYFLTDSITLKFTLE